MTLRTNDSGDDLAAAETDLRLAPKGTITAKETRILDMTLGSSNGKPKPMLRVLPTVQKPDLGGLS